MQTPAASGNTFVLFFSALTTGWIGFLGYLALKRANPETEVMPLSEVCRAKQLITERYGKSFDRQDPSTGEWWIVSESGMIIGNGETSDDAWTRSAFMLSEPHHTSLPD